MQCHDIVVLDTIRTTTFSYTRHATPHTSKESKTNDRMQKKKKGEKEVEQAWPLSPPSSLRAEHSAWLVHLYIRITKHEPYQISRINRIQLIFWLSRRWHLLCTRYHTTWARSRNFQEICWQTDHKDRLAVVLTGWVCSVLVLLIYVYTLLIKRFFYIR